MMHNDHYCLAERLGVRLSELGLTVTCAESCTGGGIGQAITAVAGSSGWFEGGVITYSNRLKATLLGVQSQCLERWGAVSEQVVLQMAEGARTVIDADLAVAISGIAGPDGGSVDKPVGTVWLAWAGRGGADSTEANGGENSRATCFQFEGDRQQVREQAVAAALQGLLDYLAVEFTETTK